MPETLGDWLCYFDSLHGKTIDLGLERIAKVAEQLSLRRLGCRVVLVGGTNGKGTTSRLLEACLLQQGFRVGLFSSPHILSYNECVRIDGEQLSDECHTQAFRRIETGRGDIPLTPFEFSTMAAFDIFKRNPLDVAIVEVGLGGRGDATNIVEPDISVITTIDIDHQAFLGNDRESIGYEKAGIMRPHKPVVIGEPDVPARVVDYARQLEAEVYQVGETYRYSSDDKKMSWHCDTLDLLALPLPNIPAQNAATVLMVLKQLDVALEVDWLAEVFAEFGVEGRMQQISDEPLVIVDVAHNPEAASYLSGQLTRLKAQGVTSVSAVVGMFKDKDLVGTLGAVSDNIDKWYLASLPEPRGATADQLLQALEKLGAGPYTYYQSVGQALDSARARWTSGELIIVFGSFVTVAAVLQGERS